jgi:ankyrin repeat protein
VIKLIDNGADVNFTDNSGGTALIEALQTYYGQLLTNKNQRALQIINRLLEADLSKSINCTSKGKGISALSLAIEAFDLEMIERLIKKGANAKGNCNKPEMSYVYYTLTCYYWMTRSSEEMIEMMASYGGANPQFGATAQEQTAYLMRSLQNPSQKRIFHALQKCYENAYQEINATEDKAVKIIKLLLDNNASPDGHFINDLSPLMYATELGLGKVAKLLLDFGANKNAVNNCGKKAIDYAIHYNRQDIKKLLNF